MASFNPEKDIPDLSGQVIFITGGTAGLGSQAITLLASHNPSKIYFTGRSTTSATTILSAITKTYPSISISFIEMDLASLASVKSGAQKFLAQNTRLDKLICNAGVMALPPGLTKDGYEIQFGTNHLGHALLVKLLLPTLIQTSKLPSADVRTIFVTSEGHGMHPVGGIIFKDLKTVQSFNVLGPWQRYGQSKLANILYVDELARRYSSKDGKGILFLSVHPGVFNTGLVKNLSLGSKMMVWLPNLMAGKSVKDEKGEGRGAWNICWAAVCGKVGEEGKSEKGGKGKEAVLVNGGYYIPVGKLGPRVRDSGNAKLAGELWEWTEKELESWE